MVILSDNISLIDVWVVAIFFIVLLCVSYYYGRNVKTVSDYALAGRKLSLPVLSMTFMATYVGANLFIRGTADIFDHGLIHVMFLLHSVPLFCFWLYIGYRYFDLRFDKHVTISDMFKYFLGSKVEKVASILYILYMIMAFGLQLTVVSSVGSYVFGQSYEIIAIVTVVIILGYTSLGGMKVVAITDVIQFGFIVLLIPYIGNHAINAAGGLGAIFTEQGLKLEKFKDAKEVSSHTFIFIECLLPHVLLFPILVQRFLIMPVKFRQQQIKFISISMLVFLLVISVSMMTIAFSAVQLYPEGKSSMIFARIMAETLPVGAKGIAMVGLLSTVMSTADSLLNTSSVILVNNLITKKMSEKNKLRLMIFISFIFGICGCVAALQALNMMQLISYTGSMCILSAYVLFLGIMRVKIEAKSFWIGLSAYIVAAIILRLIPETLTTHHHTFIMDFAGIIAFTISNIIINNGLKFVDAPDGSKVFTRKDIYSLFIKKMKGISDYLSVRFYDTIPGGYKLYVFFSVFVSVSLMMPFFMFSINSYIHYSVLFYMKVLGLFMIISISFKPYWNREVREEFPIIFQSVVSYVLVFIPFFMNFCSNFAIEWIASTVLGVFLLSIVTRMPNTFFVLILGIVSSILVYDKYFDWENISFTSERFYIFLYLSVFIGLGILILMGTRDKISRQREEDFLKLLR